MNIRKDLHMKNKSIPTPNLIAETFMSAFKIFFWIFLATNIIWAVIYFKPSNPRIGDTKVEITQSGNRDTVTQHIK